MRPILRILDESLLQRILAEAFALLTSPGVRVGSPEALQLLKSAGARIIEGIAYIPEPVVRRALDSTPKEFCLHDRQGQPTVRYGGNSVHFAPGSSCLNILDSESQRPRPAMAADLIRLVQVTEMLPQFAAQSTAMVVNDVPSGMGDWYRLLLVLCHSDKPIVTGAFSVPTLSTMLALLVADAGGADAARQKPRAVFDVCPSPPLNWSDFASQNLLTLARAGIPAEIVSMPLAGATAPVTLAGSVVQHAAETLAGIAIHQLAGPGAPIVWGGAPAIFDMSTGNTPMGAIETAMLDMACSEVGKSLGLPTHGYLVASDTRQLDPQAGAESSMSAVLGALSGINMISGAGMLDFLACHSVEKLVIDAEAIASVQRLLEGIEARGESLATGMFSKLGFSGEFLKLPETRILFRKEQHFPSILTDRGAEPEPTDLLARARTRVQELLQTCHRPTLPADREAALLAIAHREAKAFGLEVLPALEAVEAVHH